MSESTTPASEPFEDLLREPNWWSQWTPRDDVRPRFDVEVEGGPGGRTALAISGGGNAAAMGSWRFSLHDVKAGRTYRVEAMFQCEGVRAPGKSLRALLTRVEKGRPPSAHTQLDYVETRSGWTLLAGTFTADPETPLSLDLLFGWSANGRVRWSDIRLSEVDAPAEPRTVTLAAVNGNPKDPTSPADCVRFYCERIEEAASKGADLVVLPEFMNVAGLPDQATLAEPIPGPTADYLSDTARERGVNVAAGILERQGTSLYNTGLLIDRKGGLVGKYRKTHLPHQEVLMGLTPGDGYPVFDLDVGQVGYLICYDAHFPEVPRTLSLNGAEVLAFSNMGDGREKGALWESFIRTRALDSQVHIAAAVNGGRSCIVSPKGDVLAMAGKESGEIAIAECDLNQTVADYTGRPIGRRYDQVRRADSFGGLVRHLYDP